MFCKKKNISGITPINIQSHLAETLSINVEHKSAISSNLTKIPEFTQRLKLFIILLYVSKATGPLLNFISSYNKKSFV